MTSDDYTSILIIFSSVMLIANVLALLALSYQADCISKQQRLSERMFKKLERLENKIYNRTTR